MEEIYIYIVMPKLQNRIATLRIDWMQQAFYFF